MPNKQLGMEKIRQVLRCYSQGHGTKSISSMLSVSRNTVKKYLQVFQRSGLDYEQMLSLPDQELSKLFHEKSRVKTESERLGELKSLLPEYCKRLKKKGVTRERGQISYSVCIIEVDSFIIYFQRSHILFV